MAWHMIAMQYSAGGERNRLGDLVTEQITGLKFPRGKERNRGRM